MIFEKIKDNIIISYDNHLTLTHFNYGGHAYTIESSDYKFEYDYVNNRLYLKINDNSTRRIPLTRNNLHIYYIGYNNFHELELVIDSKGCYLEKKTSKS